MKISKFLKISGSIFIFSALFMIFMVFNLNKSINNRNTAVQNAAEFKQLGLDLASTSDYLTNEARAYVQFGEKVHLDNYWKEVNETKTRDRVVNNSAKESEVRALQLKSKGVKSIEEAKVIFNELIENLNTIVKRFKV